MPGSHPPWMFFALLFVLSVPFQLAGAFADCELMPGLPLAALIFICPAAAALILVYRASGRVGVRHLLCRALDGGRIANKLWYVPAVLLVPSAFLLSYAMQAWRGTALPVTQFDPGLIAGLCATFLVSALVEELGWSGYAIDPLRARWGALWASVMLGLIWAVFHLVALTQAHRSLPWIGWWTVGTVALRVIISWIYFNTGRSVFAASVVHATYNVAWQLYPVRGSHFDPQLTGLVLCAVATVAVLSCDARTLSKRSVEG